MVEDVETSEQEEDIFRVMLAFYLLCNWRLPAIQMMCLQLYFQINDQFDSSWM